MHKLLKQWKTNINFNISRVSYAEIESENKHGVGPQFMR